MQFQHIYEMPGLIEEAQSNFTQAKAVFLQNDTWVVHMFILVEERGGYMVYMMDVTKDDRETLPEYDDYANAVWDGADDETEHETIESAVQMIVGSYEFHGDNTEMSDLVEDIQLAGMSKCQANQSIEAAFDNLTTNRSLEDLST